MTEILRIFIPVYFLLFFSVAFVYKSVQTAKKIGKSPVVLPKDDSAYGLIGIYFKTTLIGLFLYAIAYGLFPGWHQYFLPIPVLEKALLKYTGIALCVITFGWVVLAQNDMKKSWRIGIDSGEKTELVTRGLFGISRNPIFFGMLLALLGLFLMTPNAIALVLLVAGYILIQIQVRLEEEYLYQQHGQAYLSYKARVRRFL